MAKSRTRRTVAAQAPAATPPTEQVEAPTEQVEAQKQVEGKVSEVATVEVVPALESITVPITPLKVAVSVSADDDARPYLTGVFVHVVDDQVRMVAMDGHRVFLFAAPAADETPEWLKSGVIIPRHALRERLSLMEKLEHATASIAYSDGAPHVVLADPQSQCTFRLSPVRVPYPNYQRVLDDAQVFEGRELTDMASVAYQGKYLKGVGDIAKQLGSETVRIFGASLDQEPSLITFPDAPGAVLILMPSKPEYGIAQATVKLLDGAVKGTLAALRAHQTRARQNNDDAKVEEYEARIGAILAQIAPQAQLPAPKDEAAEEEGSETPAVDKIEATGDDIDGAQAKRATARSKASTAARRRALKVFEADTNAALSRDNNGLTLGQLAEGVPLEGWFDAGLTAEEAALRAIEYKKPAPRSGLRRRRRKVDQPEVVVA